MVGSLEISESNRLLTPDERRLLLGGEEAVGFGLTSKLQMPQFALLFEMEKADGKKVMYAIYNVSFSPMGISAVAVEDGRLICRLV